MNSTAERTLKLDVSGGRTLSVEKRDDGFFYKSQDVSLKSFEMIERMKNQEMLCDVTLVADNVEVPAHKLILAASSIFFYTMFSNIAGNLEQRVVLDGVHCEGLNALIHYFYTSELLVTEINVRHLLRASKLLVLTDVYNACCHFLQEQLTVFNCLNIADFAREYNCSELIVQADEFIEEHISALVDSNEFLNIPYLRFSEIIKSDLLRLSGEIEVFTAVMTWIKHDTNTRLRYLSSLMEFVRFPLMSAEDLFGAVQEESLFQTNQQCQSLYIEALKYHIAKDKKQLSFSTSRTRPRQNGILMVVGDLKGKLSMERYDIIKQQWFNGPASFERSFRSNSVVVMDDRKLYMIGGANGINTVDMFDFVNEKWSKCNNLLQDRKYFAAVILDNNIYVTGGSEGDVIIQSCEMFDHGTGRWAKINDMLDVRDSHGMCTLDGKIYVAGGWDDVATLSSVECYSPETDSWTYMSDLNAARYNFGMTALNKKIYVMGGCDNENNLKSAAIFEPITGSWTQIADMNVQRGKPGVVAVNGLVYVAGGTDAENAPLNSVEVYDPRCDTWTMLPHVMNNGKQSACLAFTKFYP